MGITLFASLGLPGLNGFVGEFLIFKGVFSLASWAAALSTLGLLMHRHLHSHHFTARLLRARCRTDGATGPICPLPSA